MRSLKPKPLSSFLRSRDAGLRTLLERGDDLLRLTDQVRSCLPLPASLHCRVGGLRDGRLTLVADTPAWAARLRFYGPALVQKLNRPEQPLTRVRVIITPPTLRTQGEPRRRAQLTENTARLLSDTATGIDDAGLSAALLRLASRRRPD